MENKVCKLRRYSLFLAAVAMTALGTNVMAADSDKGEAKAEPKITIEPAKSAKSANAASSNTVALRINGEEIKMGQVEQVTAMMVQQMLGPSGAMVNPENLPPQLVNDMRNQAKKYIIDQTLVDQAIKKMDFKATDAQLKGEWDMIDSLIKSQGQGGSLKEVLQQQGVSEEQVKKELSDSLARIAVIEKETGAKVDPAEASVKAEFDKDSHKWGRMRASHILIGAKQNTGDAVLPDKEGLKKAQDILKEVKAGKDFAELAKKNSSCPSAKEGGDLNFFYFETMTPAFSEAAFKLKPGEVSDVVQTKFGYHIIKATDFQPAKYEDAKGRIIMSTRKANMNKLYPVAMLALAKTAKVEDLMPQAAPAAAPKEEGSAPAAKEAAPAPKAPEAKK